MPWIINGHRVEVREGSWSITNDGAMVFLHGNPVGAENARTSIEADILVEQSLWNILLDGREDIFYLSALDRSWLVRPVKFAHQLLEGRGVVGLMGYLENRKSKSNRMTRKEMKNAR